MSAFRAAISVVSFSISSSKASMRDSVSSISRLALVVFFVFSLNASTQKSFLTISSAFSFIRAAIMSSMAFFTLTKASKRTLVAMAARRGLPTFFATAESTFAAWERRSEFKDVSFCRSAGLKVFVKTSWASSPLKMATALETASISICRVFCRASHSASVAVHFSFSIKRNCSSAESEFFVSAKSSSACAIFASVSASSKVFLSTWFFPAAI
mmetsp:Transcript_14706/g.26088  ORF Transcript_14706/g.26088 Transcript_14706/m.26088 type:complete len:213 (+) Transcript_14706:609-1247(+)